MVALWCSLGILAVLCIGVLITAFVCYRMAFYSPPRKPRQDDKVWLPQGEIYEKYWGSMEKWAREVRAMPCQEVTVTSYDGLTLHGKFYEYAPGAPIELMIHGYRGGSERDMPGGVQRCFKLGRSALLIDQRSSGKSDGHTITFGIKEHRDCLTWVDFLIKNYGSDVKIILTGISMGASTVLMAAGKPLPPNVIGVLADCGYSNAKEIIQKVIGEMDLPVKLAYPFVRLGARIYGGFGLESYSALEAMKTCTVPVFFIHGEDDDFVPCNMSRAMYEACSSRKQLVTVPGAGHGLSVLIDPELYYSSLQAFFGLEASALSKTK